MHIMPVHLTKSLWLFEDYQCEYLYTFLSYIDHHQSGSNLFCVVLYEILANKIIRRIYAVLARKIIRCIYLCSCFFMSCCGRDLNAIRDGKHC